MKKIGLFLLIFCWAAMSVSAQSKPEYVLQVVAESAFVREVPDEAAKYAILAAINLVNCIATAKRSGSRS